MRIAQVKEQLLSMHLVHQEILIEIISQLHERGLVDAPKIFDHVENLGRAPDMGKYSRDVAEVFAGRMLQEIPACRASAGLHPIR